MIMAIDTKYNGYNFRSRLEARWAVFMDTIDVGYEYEPEGYNLDGVLYLPDFWIPSLDCFLEIKPLSPNNKAESKAESLAMKTQKNVLVFVGQHALPEHQEDDMSAYLYCATKDDNGTSVMSYDYCYYWCECPACGKCGIESNGRAERLKCGCVKNDNGQSYYNYDSPKIIEASAKAKSYRF